MSGFSWYNPNSSYGQSIPNYDPWKSQIGQALEDDNPEGTWTRWASEMGYGGVNQKSDLVRGLYNRAAEGFGAAQTKNHNLKWRDYLYNINPDELLGSLSPEARGESNRIAAGGKDRWGLR